MATSRLYLVDSEGQPLPDHIIEAVEIAEPHISKKFRCSCDPAELASSMEETARKIASRELKQGRLRDVTSYTFKALTNRALSLCGLRSRQTSLSDRTLACLTDVRGSAEIELTARGREIERKLSHLSERDRHICELVLQNYAIKEIGEELSITEATVRKVLSRVRASIAAT